MRFPPNKFNKLMPKRKESDAAMKNYKSWVGAVDRAIADVKEIIKETDAHEIGELKELRSIAAALRLVKKKASDVAAAREQTNAMATFHCSICAVVKCSRGKKNPHKKSKNAREAARIGCHARRRHQYGDLVDSASCPNPPLTNDAAARIQYGR